MEEYFLGHGKDNEAGGWRSHQSNIPGGDQVQGWQPLVGKAQSTAWKRSPQFLWSSSLGLWISAGEEDLLWMHSSWDPQLGIPWLVCLLLWAIAHRPQSWDSSTQTQLRSSSLWPALTTGWQNWDWEHGGVQKLACEVLCLPASLCWVKPSYVRADTRGVSQWLCWHPAFTNDLLASSVSLASSVITQKIVHPTSIALFLYRVPQPFL